MIDINELSEIINDNGGTASIDEIAERYGIKNRFVIQTEHKALIGETLRANPDKVKFNEETKLWSLANGSPSKSSTVILNAGPREWNSMPSAKIDIETSLKGILDGSCYYCVREGKDENSLYVFKDDEKKSVLHIYPKVGRSPNNGLVDVVVRKNVYESMRNLIEMPPIKVNEKDIVFKGVEVSELYRYCKELVKHSFY